MVKRLHAWFLGVRDGLCYQELSFGMTWENWRLSNSYDAGVNVGQAIAEVVREPHRFLP